MNRAQHVHRHGGLDLIEWLDLPRSRVISQLVREFVEKREAIQEEGA